MTIDNRRRTAVIVANIALQWAVFAGLAAAPWAVDVSADSPIFDPAGCAFVWGVGGLWQLLTCIGFARERTSLELVAPQGIVMAGYVIGPFVWTDGVLHPLALPTWAVGLAIAGHATWYLTAAWLDDLG